MAMDFICGIKLLIDLLLWKNSCGISSEGSYIVHTLPGYKRLCMLIGQLCSTGTIGYCWSLV